MAALIACSQILTGDIIGLTVNHIIINNTLIHEWFHFSEL